VRPPLAPASLSATSFIEGLSPTLPTY
jgi:hypothetical protein